jgi:O-methyltransferase involved in polyketide biosynthesis
VQFGAPHSRDAEDQLAKAIEQGVPQYVVLVTGLDRLAYRNPYSGSDLCLFEVDHPPHTPRNASACRLRA